MRAKALYAGLVLAAAVAAFAAPVNGSSIDEKIKSEQARIHAAHEALKSKRAQLHAAESRVSDLHAQLGATTRNIARVSAALDVVRARAHQNEKQLAWNRLQLAAAKATVARHDAALRRRLVDAYEHGDLGYLEVLLEARSFADFVERWNDIRYIIRANETTLRSRRAAQAKVALAERGLLANEARLRATLADEEQKRRELDALAQQRRNLLSVASNEQHTVARQVAQLDDISASAEGELQELIRQKQAEEEARRRAAEEAARRAALLSGGTPPPVTSGAPGALAWPVSGPITDPFGMRTHPVTGQYAMHTGIDIAAGMGTTVVAPANGTIIIAGWNDGGYGNMIVIDHGGSMSTLYGHLSQIFVSAGQEVTRGQAIGAVGSTGRSTGPHLHFEVRINGQPTDPMSYLR